MVIVSSRLTFRGPSGTKWFIPSLKSQELECKCTSTRDPSWSVYEELKGQRCKYTRAYTSIWDWPPRGTSILLSWGEASPSSPSLPQSWRRSSRCHDPHPHHQPRSHRRPPGRPPPTCPECRRRGLHWKLREGNTASRSSEVGPGAKSPPRLFWGTQTSELRDGGSQLKSVFRCPTPLFPTTPSLPEVNYLFA